MWPFRRKEAPCSRTDRLVFAIGDVHGRCDLLEPLFERILKDAARHADQQPLVITLGDYVDRGPNSRGVLEFLSGLTQHAPAELCFLRGNHEAVMSGFLSDARQGPGWALLGGRETLKSYGVAPPIFNTDLQAWEQAREALAQALPTRHRAFLDATELSVTVGDYLFVHAGVRPGVPLAHQRDRDMMWIRDPFTRARRSCRHVVVHGHTPVPEPRSLRWRIGVDTGAYLTGTLTALRAFEFHRDFLQETEVPHPVSGREKRIGGS